LVVLVLIVNSKIKFKFVRVSLCCVKFMGKFSVADRVQKGIQKLFGEIKQKRIKMINVFVNNNKNKNEY